MFVSCPIVSRTKAWCAGLLRDLVRWPLGGSTRSGEWPLQEGKDDAILFDDDIEHLVVERRRQLGVHEDVGALLPDDLIRLRGTLHQTQLDRARLARDRSRRDLDARSLWQSGV